MRLIGPNCLCPTTGLNAVFAQPLSTRKCRFYQSTRRHVHRHSGLELARTARLQPRVSVGSMLDFGIGHLSAAREVALSKTGHRY